MKFFYTVTIILFFALSCQKPHSDSSSDPKIEISLEQMMYYANDGAIPPDSAEFERKYPLLLDEFKRLTLEGKTSEAYGILRKLKTVADTLKDKEKMAQVYFCFGINASKMGNISIAGKNFYSSYVYFHNRMDSIKMSKILRTWGRACYENSVYDSAKTLTHSAVKFDKKLNDEYALKIDYTYLGRTFLAIYRGDPIYKAKIPYDSAFHYIRKAAALNPEVPENSDSDCEQLLDEAFFELYYYKMFDFKDRTSISKLYYDSCLMYFPKALESARNRHRYEILKTFNLMAVKMMIHNGEIDNAQHYADSIYSMAGKYPDFHAETGLFAYSFIHEARGEFKDALKAKNLALKYQQANMSYREQLFLSLQLGRGQFESEQTKAYGKQLAKEGRIRMLNGVVIGGIIATFIVISFLIYVINSRRRYKALSKRYMGKSEEVERQNEKLSAKNEEIKAQSEKIKVYNEELTASINYASRIQHAVLPSKNDMKRIFGDNLLIYKPKDIVSGDFFWALETLKYKILVAGDCTGHGVPGALLSMLGMSCLEYTTRHIERKNSTAGEILDQMRSVIKSTLNQEIFEDENHDAIDMALLIIDIRNMKLQFAGANRPLLIIRNGEIIRTKGDSMPVGVFLMEKEHFTNHVINLEPNDIIYVFSDGIPDQFGYREGHNESEIFNVRRFYSLLKEICGLPFEVQREKIQTTLREWSKNKTASEDFCEQTDDNLLIGLSVKDMIKATENVLW